MELRTTHDLRARFDWYLALGLYRHGMFQPGARPDHRAVPWKNSMTVLHKDAGDSLYEAFVAEKGAK